MEQAVHIYQCPPNYLIALQRVWNSWLGYFLFNFNVFHILNNHSMPCIHDLCDAASRGLLLSFND